MNVAPRGARTGSDTAAHAHQQRPATDQEGAEPGDALAARFESHRSRLRAVAYRMLGSVAEADDAVQEAWLRLARVDPDTIANLGGWLTTVVARVCLDALRARAARRELPAGVHLPDPVVSGPDGPGPEQEALLADSVGLALLVVLDTLTPAERVAFVLHDAFAVPFDEIAAAMGRSTAAVKQLASRGRRRVGTTAPVPDTDVARQRAVTDAFLAAARGGDLGALLALLDPDVVVRADFGPGQPGASRVLRGAPAVAREALGFARLADAARPALVNGAAGRVVSHRGEVFSVMAFTVAGGRVAAIDILADPCRLRALGLAALGLAALDLAALDPAAPDLAAAGVTPAPHGSSQG